MKALTETDLCFSTNRIFNSDGIKRDFVDPSEARRAFEFEIVRKQSFDESGRPIPGQYHLRKSTDDSFIPSVGVGGRFTPVQHLDAYDFIVNEIMPRVPGMELETAGTLYGSGMGIVMAKMGADFKIPGDDSPNAKRLFFSNPCNGRGSVVVGMTTVRLFCQNQIAAARRDAVGNGGFSVMHTKNANFLMASFLKSIELQIRMAEEIRHRSERLADISLSEGLAKRVLDRVYPTNAYEPGTRGETHAKNLQDEVYMQIEGGETAMTMKTKTAWSLFNSITYPIFNPSNMRSSTDSADISYRGMDGSISKRVTKIFNIVESEALAS
ncbi:MAG: DUF945 domain-containing protein [Bacteroidales bacterium]|nr:DUF945 domain-containing protein [Bacteroidales bacterium]